MPLLLAVNTLLAFWQQISWAMCTAYLYYVHYLSLLCALLISIIWDLHESQIGQKITSRLAFNNKIFQLTFICSNSTIETLGHGVK